MANQFIDKVNDAFDDGLNHVAGFGAVKKFYDDYGKVADEKAKARKTLEVSEINTGEAPEQETGKER